MKVSLIIPAYNVENLIEMTLKSVQNQTLNSFECIIVNDFSKDSTQEVVREFIKNDKRFKLINHRANAGVNAARNSGLRFAKGKYVAFLDGDDLIMPESLELRAKTLDANFDNMVIGTYAGSVTIDMDCKVPPEIKDVNLKKIDFITTGGNCPFNVNQPMFNAEIFKKIGGFDQSLTQSEDYEMWMRMLRYGYKVIPTQKQLVTYRQTEGSAIRDNPLLHLKNSYTNFNNCYTQYTEQKFTNKLEIHLHESLASYMAQINIANRVLEFIGLGLAKGENLQLLEEKLKEYLPQYFEAVESHRPFLPRVKIGINRYYKKNIDLATEEYKGLHEKIHTLYNNFKINSQKIHTLPRLKKELSYSFADIVGNPGIQAGIDLIFIPHKDYHVYTISLMKQHLEEQGIKFIVLDISMHYRDERAISACQKYNLPHIGYSNFVLGNFKPKAIVVFNDWDPINRSILLEAKKVGIPTIGIVEGIQDYLDADTKQDRKAYQVVDYLFLPGKHDEKYFNKGNQQVFIGGIPRIVDLYSKYKNKQRNFEEKVALINSNFSYGVLEEHRDEWLDNAVNACKKAGYKVIISKHPADKGRLFEELVTNDSFYEALEKSTVLVSRFASGILESLAMNVLPIYFNPHQEQVDKFQNSLGAYPVTNSLNELVDVLESYSNNIEKYKKNFFKFLEFHCGDPRTENSSYIAEKIYWIINNANIIDEDDYEYFYEGLAKLDLISGCFNNLSTLRTINAEILTNNNNTASNKKEHLSLKTVYNFIQKSEYQQAQNTLNILKELHPDNPAYLFAQNTLEIYVKP